MKPRGQTVFKGDQVVELLLADIPSSRARTIATESHTECGWVEIGASAAMPRST